MSDEKRLGRYEITLPQAATGLDHLWSSAWKWVLVGVLMSMLLGCDVGSGSPVSPGSTPTTIVGRVTDTVVPTLSPGAQQTETWTPEPAALPTNTPSPTATVAPQSTPTETQPAVMDVQLEV